MEPSDLREIGKVLIEGLETGLHINNLRKGMLITDSEMEELREAFPEIRLLIRTAQVNYHNELMELVRMGSASPSLLSFLAKTAWRNFYPQEIETTDEDRLRESAASILKVINKRTLN